MATNMHAAVCSESHPTDQTQALNYSQDPSVRLLAVFLAHMATSIDLKVMEYNAHNDELCCGANIFQHLPVERRLQIV